MRLFIEVTDNRGIDTFAIDAPEFGIDTLVVFDPVNPRYIFVKDYTVPELIPDGTYFINLLATDSTSNKSEQSISIAVGTVAVGEVYCVGGATWSGWDPPDNPMLMRQDVDNPGWYEIITYSFIDPNDLEKLHILSENIIKLKNPVNNQISIIFNIIYYLR